MKRDRQVLASEKKRILHIRDSSGIFGGERVILTLGRNIDRALFDFTLMCMRRGDGRSDALIAGARRAGIPVEGVEVRGRLDAGALSRLREFIAASGVDLIHTHDFKSDFYGLVATRGMRVKRIATAHGSTRDSLAKRLYLSFDEHVVYRRFDRIVAVSEDIRLRLAAKLPDPSKIRVIQNGLDMELLSVCGNGPEPPLPHISGGDSVVFGVIGRLYPDKGHAFFLRAFERIAGEFPNAVAVIVGDGPEMGNIQARVSALGLEGRVYCCGVRKDMERVYRSIDYLVIPSLTEGLPYVMLEAMASGIPVLATAVGDIPLLIRDGITGFLVRPGDAFSLGRRMRDLITMPDRAREMAREAGKLIKEQYSAASMVRKTQDLYLSLLM